MISISAWFHIKKQGTQLSLKSSAETCSEPRWQWKQYSVCVSPPILLYLWPSTNHSSLWTSGSTLSNEGLKLNNLNSYSSHCILDYSNMSLSVHVSIGHDWDTGRWQGIHSYQWNALQLWTSQTWTGSGSDGRQRESVGCGSLTTTKLVSLTGLQFWICTRRHTL